MRGNCLLIFAVFALALGRVAAGQPDEAVRAIVEGERKFYQTGQEKGTRAAFLEFLAPDAIVFRPGPVNGQEVWSKRAETGLDLVWEPTFAAIARSADLGYDTGPSKWRANKREEKFSGFGHFISIWKKQEDGSWKVALDCGLEHPEPTAKAEALRTYVPEGPAKLDTRFWAGTLKNFHEAARDDSTKAIMQWAAPEIRVYRDGHFPAVGREAAERLLADMSGQTTYHGPYAGGSSSLGDLGYNYGKYSTVRAKGKEEGHYLQIWQIDSSSAWKLVLDWQQPLAP